MAPNTPVIECKGRLMLASQYKAPNKKQITPPYVFHYHVGDVLEICLDGKTYGNYSFCYFKYSKTSVKAFFGTKKKQP